LAKCFSLYVIDGPYIFFWLFYLKKGSKFWNVAYFKGSYNFFSSSNCILLLNGLCWELSIVYWRANQKQTIQRNWQHRTHNTKKCANFQNLKVFIFHWILMQFLWSVYINGLLVDHNFFWFISERGLIGAQIPNGLCWVLW
jgi:hypothetical protein